MEKKYLIIGIGNPLLTDDAAGLLVLNDIRKFLNDCRNTTITVKENYSFGIDLLEEITGYEKILIIDSFISDVHEPGTCVFFEIDNLNSVFIPVTSHGININTLWRLGSMLELSMPDECSIMGIAAYDCSNFSEKLSDRLTASYDSIINKIKNKVKEWI